LRYSRRKVMTTATMVAMLIARKPLAIQVAECTRYAK
jgi:hypothetical protein